MKLILNLLRLLPVSGQMSGSVAAYGWIMLACGRIFLWRSVPLVLERESDRELQLPRVQRGAWQAEVRIWRGRYEQIGVDRRGRKASDKRWNEVGYIPHGAGYGRRPMLDGQGHRIVVVVGDAAAEYGRAVDRGNLIHVRPVEEVERIERQVHRQALVEVHVPRQAQIPVVFRISGVGVPRDHGVAVRDARTRSRHERRPADTIGGSPCH